MTTAEAIARPHSHGAPSDMKGHPTRGDRPSSFNLDDIPVPNGREEDWRFTPIRRIRRLFDPENYDDNPVLPLVDAPENVSVETVAPGNESLGKVLGPGDRTAVVAWNIFKEATVITIPAKAEVKKPIIVTIDGQEGTHAQHIVVKAGELSCSTVIITHVGGDKMSLNQTIEVEAADAAQLTIVSTQEWNDTAVHASNHRIALGKDAKVHHIVVSLGGDLVRICADTDFRGPGGELKMDGLYFVDAKQHLEHRIFVDHSQPDCYGRVTYKGALQGKDAHSVWIGDCLIRENADNTDTYELNRNLVLTEGAMADSVPNLEIENGEIKGAGHASATGRFDDEHLFYLMSRGIDEMDARRLVVRGFFAELISQIGVTEVQEHLMAAIERELETSNAIEAAFASAASD